MGYTGLNKSLFAAAAFAAAAFAPAYAADPIETVAGPEVQVTAGWNEGRDGRGVYTAPPGYAIRQITVQVVSAAGSTNYRTEIVGNKAIVHAYAHGEGKFYDQRRGWLHVKSTVYLEKAPS